MGISVFSICIFIPSHIADSQQSAVFSTILAVFVMI
jgi:hypothetical protein